MKTGLDVNPVRLLGDHFGVLRSDAFRSAQRGGELPPVADRRALERTAWIAFASHAWLIPLLPFNVPRLARDAHRIPAWVAAPIAASLVVGFATMVIAMSLNVRLLVRLRRARRSGSLH